MREEQRTIRGAVEALDAKLEVHLAYHQADERHQMQRRWGQERLFQLVAAVIGASAAIVTTLLTRGFHP
jgi:hypothetical protein